MGLSPVSILLFVREKAEKNQGRAAEEEEGNYPAPVNPFLYKLLPIYFTARVHKLFKVFQI